MLLVPTPMFLASSIVFPAVTVGVADIGGTGAFFGYARPGGYMSSLTGGMSGGTLSATLVPGFVTDGVMYISGDDASILIGFIGDCVSLLSGVTALMDNGTPLPLSEPPEYYPEDDLTGIAFSGSWTSTGNRTIQLV